MKVAVRNGSLLGRLAALFASALVVFSCESSSGESSGGETHFLTHCVPGSDSCGSKLSCLCGVCTAPCSQRAACERFAAAECVPPTCTDSREAGYCDVGCFAEADCAALSSAHHCENGVCRAGSPVLHDGGAGSSGGGASDASADANSAGASGACVRGAVAANEVLLIGDAFFASSHQVTAYLEDLARSSGAISSGDRYRDNSRLTANGLALGGNGIADQYTSAASDAAVKVVIMNGGGADILLGSCDTPDAACPPIAAAASAAHDLFAKMAADGIDQVVYVFYPDPVDSDVRAKMDALRPLIESACNNSPVPCHWLDLRPTFAGQYASYIQVDGLNPTAAGSKASAAAIWQVMQEACIAQ
jgi:lysophospholipase L1-like esterase